MSNLLTVHIFVGVIALTSALISVFTKKGKEFHKISGRVYFVSMIFIFLSALRSHSLIKMSFQIHSLK